MDAGARVRELAGAVPARPDHPERGAARALRRGAGRGDGRDADVAVERRVLLGRSRRGRRGGLRAPVGRAARATRATASATGCSTGPTSRSVPPDRAFLRLDVVSGNRRLRDYYEAVGLRARPGRHGRVRRRATGRARTGAPASTSAPAYRGKADRAGAPIPYRGSPAKGEARCCRPSCSNAWRSSCSRGTSRSTRPSAGRAWRCACSPQEPHRGSYAAAQRFVIDDPVFRADLFDQTTHPAGQPAQRALPFALRRRRADRPAVARRDQDRPDGLARGRAERSRARPRARRTSTASRRRRSSATPPPLRDAVPAIVAAVEATWDSVRSAPV